MAEPGAGVLAATCRLDVAHRADPLDVRVTVPAAAGGRLPAVVFSHGDGRSAADYAPLAEAWARHGLAVMQPTHADAPAQGPPWLLRLLDLHAVAVLAAQAASTQPGLLPGPRLAPGRLLAAGHSLGAHTAALLLGAWPEGRDRPALAVVSLAGGVLLAPPGDGRPPNLAADWQAKSGYLSLDWSAVAVPVLSVIGTRDPAPMATRGWRWRADGFVLSPPGNKSLLVCDADHYLGGIARGRAGAATPGRDVSDPPMLERVAALTAAALLHPGEAAAPGPEFTLHRR